MIYLSDNDILEKLARCDLLDDFLTAYGSTRRDVFVVETLKYRLKRPSAAKRLGADGLQRILAFLEQVNIVHDYSREDHLLLAELQIIDIGETILLSAAGLYDDFRLATGDKRCLKAIATHPGCLRLAERIKGKVVCFEQIIRTLIGHFGFDHVRSKVVPALDCDVALRAAFGSGVDSTEDNCVDCLNHYIDELRRLPIDLLLLP